MFIILRKTPTYSRITPHIQNPQWNESPQRKDSKCSTQLLQLKKINTTQIIKKIKLNWRLYFQITHKKLTTQYKIYF